MVENETSVRKELIRQVALRIMAAARTAPKACGRDNLTIAMITAPEAIERLAADMDRVSETEEGRNFFARDAGNIRASDAVVFIGTGISVLNLNCGLCGWALCEKKPSNAPCAFNMHDLGLAVGSAVSVAADMRIDSRVMFSAGTSAMNTGMMAGCHSVMAIPLSVSGKSPYFDRKPKEASCAR